MKCLPFLAKHDYLEVEQEPCALQPPAPLQLLMPLQAFSALMLAVDAWADVDAEDLSPLDAQPAANNNAAVAATATPVFPILLSILRVLLLINSN